MTKSQVKWEFDKPQLQFTLIERPGNMIIQPVGAQTAPRTIAGSEFSLYYRVTTKPFLLNKKSNTRAQQIAGRLITWHCVAKMVN